MSWFGAKSEPVELDVLFDRYAAVLENGPRSGGTIYDLDQLPADKPLLKGVLLQKAYQLGGQADDILKTGFVQLAAFQIDTRELNGQQAVVDEMGTLMKEWDFRVRYPEASE